ncbi:MAG: Gmad2 immunoglobulin-like domain-containing protein [Acidimicrobiia bacterium]
MSAIDDQRLKELAERIVELAPEPPQYPGDVDLIARKTVTRKWSPVLVVAGAAALVLAGVGLPLLLSGQETAPDPVATSLPGVIDSTVPVATSIASVTTLSSTETTVEQTAQSVVFETVVYLVTDPASSFTGNPALVPFHTTLLGDENTNVTLATLQLLGNPDQTVEPPQGFYNAVPPGVEFYEATAKKLDQMDVLVLDVSKNFVEGAGGLLADVTMLNQIVFTATENGFDRVQFTVDGELVDTFGSEGILIGDGTGRSDFVDQLSPIIITSPFVLGGDELPRVAGLANVYEATVSMRIVWAESGEIVYEDYTTASCGTGCWGEYEFILDNSALEPGQLIQVFWDSPEDGSMRDIVSYPVGPDGRGWDLFPTLDG